MKEMSCKDFDGPCDLKFQGETLDAIAEKVKDHGRELAQKGDKYHQTALDKLETVLDNPEESERWIKKKQSEFDALPEVD